jgi:hypothetical protein
MRNIFEARSEEGDARPHREISRRCVGVACHESKPEHFVDERLLADFHASLERAAWVLEQKTAKDLQE